jgi:predicted Zn-dependent protease
MSTTRRHALLSLLGLAALPLAADEPKPVTPAYNNMTDEQEISLGRECCKEIEKQEKLKIIENSSLQDYVNHVFQKVVKTSRRPHLPYSIKIVDTTQVNAFSLPGGFVYLNRGLMEFAQNEAEMMGVLAHEVGHVVGRHGANNICRERSADSLMSEASRILLGDDTPAQLLKQLGGPVAALALLKYSREQESEADLLGFYNVQRAGWTPEGMITFFKRLDTSPGEMQSVLAFGSDHPASAERAERLRAETRDFPPAGNLALTSDGFRAMQAHLKKMAPVPKPTRLVDEN